MADTPVAEHRAETYRPESDPTTGSTVGVARLGLPLLAIPILLILIYGMLSYLAFADQSFFYESMDIPTPANEFLLWSWGGKNTAMLTVLIIATVTRLRVVMVTALAMLVVGQMGDVNAGAQSGTNVFITWIAFGLVVVQAALLWFDHRRTAGGGVASA